MPNVGKVLSDGLREHLEGYGIATEGALDPHVLAGQVLIMLTDAGLVIVEEG